MALIDQQPIFERSAAWDPSFLFRRFAAHPYITLALLCLAGTAMFLGGSEYALSSRSLLCLFTLLAITAAAALLCGRWTGVHADTWRCLSITAAVAVALVLYVALSKTTWNIALLFVLGAAATLLFLVGMRCRHRLTTAHVVAAILFLGFLLRLIYVLYTTIYVRQHDVADFGLGEGHLSYIEHFFQHNSLPEGDVRESWQFYHPPLHHLLMGLWLRLLCASGLPLEEAAEGLQFLTLYYSCACMLILYRLLRLFKVRGTALIAALAVVAFHPTFLFLSGAVNNDMLSITFLLGAVLNTVSWYRSPTCGNIVKIALCVGLGMMTKLSVWMVAPGIALVFLLVLLRHRQRPLPLIGQMATFGAICVPLGLWWGVRNYVLYKISPAYIPSLTFDNPQYVGDRGVFTRLFDFSPIQFTSVYEQFTFYGGAYYEYNPTISLFKTAMFDEVSYVGIDPLAKSLFWSGVVLAIVAFAAMLVVLIHRHASLDGTMKLFFALVYGVIVVSYYLFCFKYPFTCTQNIRYAVPLIALGAFFLGLLLQRLSETTGKPWCRAVRIAVLVGIAVFCLAAAVTYTIISVTPIVALTG